MLGTNLAANPSEAVSLCKNARLVKQLLRWSGIPVGKEESAGMGGIRLYRATVCHHHVLSVERKPSHSPWLLHPLPVEESTAPVPVHAEDPEVKVVTYLAVRSVYAVGLECAHVTVAAHSPTRAKVLKIEPHFVEEDVLSRWDAQHAAKTESGDIMLGADPEFALRSLDGSMVLASDFLGKHGTVGCDSTRYREELGMHQWPLVELRPKPTQDPDELFLFLHRALQVARSKIASESIEWLAGGMPFDGYPIGGHIHFSGIAPAFPLLRKLDAYLALPLVLIEDEGCRKRRPRYGFLGDFREKSYGGFEYRTLPSWLVTPTVTRGVLHLAKLVASHYRELSPQPFWKPSLVRAYYAGDKDRLRPLVRSMWQELSRLPAYQQSRGPLDAFYGYVLSGATWPAHRDIREAWKLAPKRAIMDK